MEITIHRISIHAPARGATYFISFKLIKEIFQSTLPQGERRVPGAHDSFIISFQSTLPQGERQLDPNAWVTFSGISIHAPARGATVIQPMVCKDYEISIHAPARGATLVPNDWVTFSGISIHAPARGATPIQFLVCDQFIGFQSTLPQGERRIVCRTLKRFYQFQSTLPQGERQDRAEP